MAPYRHCPFKASKYGILLSMNENECHVFEAIEALPERDKVALYSSILDSIQQQYKNASNPEPLASIEF